MGSVFYRFWSENKGLITLCLVGILIRLLYLWEYSSLPDWEQLTVDNNYHHHWALSIVNGNLIGDTTYFRSPFYIFYLAGIYKIFGTSLWAVRLIGIIPGILSIIFTYKIAKSVYNKHVGLAAAAIHTFYPIIYYFESELLLDSLFLLLLQIAVYLFIKWWDTKTNLTIFLSGLFFSLSAITRPTALIIIPIIIISFFLITKDKLRFVSVSIIFLVGVSICILPVFIRNIKIANDPVLIASQGGINLYLGNNEAANGISAVMPEPLGFNWRIKQVTFKAEQEMKRKLKPGEVSSYWMGEAIQWIKLNPKQFFTLYLQKLYHNISNREISNNRYLGQFFDKIILLKYNYLSFGVLFSLSAISLFLTGMTNKKALFLLAILLSYIIVSSLFFFSSRFRLPLLSFYIILSANSLVILQIQLRQNIKSAVILCSMLIVVGLISFVPIVALPKGSASQSIVSKGIYYSAYADYKKALTYFKTAKDIDPNFTETNLNIGAVFMKLGNLDSALYYMNLEKNMHPQQTKPYINLASIYFTQKQYREAIVEIKEALRMIPYDLTANLVHLRIVDAVDTTSQAVFLSQTIQTAIRRTEYNIYYLNEAAVYLSNRNQFASAENILLQAIGSSPPPIETDDASFLHISPNSPKKWEAQKAQAYYQLGYLKGLNGIFTDAVNYSLKAIAINPELAEAYINLISGYFSLNQVDLGLKILEEALLKFPNNPNVQRIQQLVEKQKKG